MIIEIWDINDAYRDWHVVCIILFENVVVLTTTNNLVIHDGHMDTLESVGMPNRETI